jgi:RNA polymerase sigma factor (sigma-70 family)
MNKELRVTAHLGIVHHHARSLCRQYHLQFKQHFPDLLGVGMVALVEAGNHFHTEKNVAFSTYCWLRIKGAMLDHIRREGRYASMHNHPLCERQTNPNIEAEVVAREHLRLLDRAVDQLPLRRQKFMEAIVSLKPLADAAEEVVVDIRKARKWRREYLREWEEMLEVV